MAATNRRTTDDPPIKKPDTTGVAGTLFERMLDCGRVGLSGLPIHYSQPKLSTLRCRAKMTTQGTYLAYLFMMTAVLAILSRYALGIIPFPNRDEVRTQEPDDTITI